MKSIFEHIQDFFSKTNYASRTLLLLLIISFGLSLGFNVEAWTAVNIFIAVACIIYGSIKYRQRFWSLGLDVVAPYLILILGFFTYFLHYENPPHLFWDENYYLTAATKYEKHIFFEESHPPLGKLLIAAGDSIVNANPGIAVDFEKNDFTKGTPPNFSFKGMRFAPVFFAWMNALVFFALLSALTGSSAWALTLSFLYLLDNALIVHSRGAMLDSIQIFGILLALLSFFKSYKDGKFSKRWICALGLGVAWATWTKLNGLIVVTLFPLLLLYPKGLGFRERLRKLMPMWSLGAAAFLIFSVIVWQTHFSLGKNIEPSLQNQGWYKASDELKEIKLHPEEHSNVVRNFSIELRDYLAYMKQYAAGVPLLDMCKKGENGSPFYWWPFGSRTISYRWETQDRGNHVSYLYLVPNPISWGLGLLAVVLSIAFFIMMPLFGGVQFVWEEQLQVLALFILYACYMISIARIPRVMYTYHYFIPLIFSYALAGKWIPRIVSSLAEWVKKEFDDLHDAVEPSAQVFLMLSLTGAWFFMRPLTYYYPLTCNEFKDRAIFNGWQMRGINCEFGVDHYKAVQPLPPNLAPAQPTAQMPPGMPQTARMNMPPPGPPRPGMLKPGTAAPQPPGAKKPDPLQFLEKQTH